MNVFSREGIEAFAFVGIHSLATGHVASEVASMVKSPIAKAVVLGTTMAANAYIGYRLGEFVEGYSWYKDNPKDIHLYLDL